MSYRRHIDPGTVYHFIARFVAKEWFIRSDTERNGYLWLLGECIVKTDWRCLAFAIMSNHIHLVLRAGHAKMSSWSRDTHADFAKWINQRLGRIGSVFVHESKTIGVQPEGVAAVIAYVHQNPVRAGVVRAARDSSWTSHQQYLGEGMKRPWLDVSLGLERAGFADGEEFDRWITQEEIDRESVDGFAIRPRRGRPPTTLETYTGGVLATRRAALSVVGGSSY